jgi:secondary thiamine-phosphate synthase enzyme
MKWFKTTIELQTQGKGMYAFDGRVQAQLRAWGVHEGMCYLYLPHTSASLVISENYDPTAKADLETFMERQVPENQAWMEHTLEGGDDSSSHVRAMLTDVSLAIPVDEGRLSLGTWQGIFLFEHRARPHRRQVLVRMMEVGE